MLLCGTFVCTDLGWTGTSFCDFMSRSCHPLAFLEARPKILWFFPARESCSSFFNYTPRKPRDPKKNKIGLGWYSRGTLSLRGQNKRTQVSSRFVVVCLSCGSIVSCWSPARSLEVEPTFNFPLRRLHRCLGEIHTVAVHFT